jgi:uncharacterized membrane protein
MIKKHFLTGLALILPLVLTLFIVNFVLGWVTRPFMGIVQSLLTFVLPGSSSLIHNPFVLRLISQILILFLLAAFIIGLGFLTETFLMRKAIKIGDAVFHAIPVANKVYKAVQDVLKNLFNQERPSFSQVALVPFPQSNTMAVGFVTQSAPVNIEGKDLQGYTSIFLPGTPNPMMGFILLVPQDKVKKVSMSFEEAVKFVASCGVIYRSPKDQV